MGFLNDLGKAFMGKPLGPASTQQASQQLTQSPLQGNGLVDENGRKIIPDIDVKNVDSDRNGDRLIVTAWIENRTDQEIRIDKTYLLKQSKTPNQILGPRQSRELRLYDGPIPDNENERTAQITFRLQKNQDVFMGNYRINYDLESDGKRTVGDLIDDGPTRDI